MTLADEPGHRGSACTARDHARLGAPPVQIGYTPRHPTPPKRRPMSPNVPASQRAYLPSTPGAPCRCTAPSTPCTPIRPLIHPRRPRTDRRLQSPFAARRVLPLRRPHPNAVPAPDPPRTRPPRPRPRRPHSQQRHRHRLSLGLPPPRQIRHHLPNHLRPIPLSHAPTTSAPPTCKGSALL